MNPLRFPINSQPFEEIRKRGLMYIDKTALVYEMTHSDIDYVFLSRPRRFGKSLLVSTLKAYFEGRKELFEGLAIEQLEKEWTKYPVLHFDMSLGKHLDLAQLERLIANLISTQEELNGMPITEGDANVRLTNLIRRLYEKTGQKVVVLIDEYDAQLLDVMHEEEELPARRNIMRNFYSPLKGSADYIRFVFLTGITKFSQLSIFSELNNIKNFSMDEKYASICGITEEEMLTQMRLGIEQMAQKEEMSYDEAVEQLKLTYDGYHFAWPSPDIYNPYSLLNALNDRKIESYWFGSGTPTYLIEMLRKFDVLPQNIGRQYAKASQFDAPTEMMTNILPLLYQSGYLTIKHYSREDREYLLDIPNEEVRIGLMESLLPEYLTPVKDYEGRKLTRDLNRAMREGRIEDALTMLQTFLSGVPYENEKYSEAHFQSLLYVIFSLVSSFIVQTEVRTATGRMDLAVRTRSRIYLFELKFDGSAREALRQIDVKNYSAPFSLEGLPIVKVGVNFSSETRTISEWIIE